MLLIPLIYDDGTRVLSVDEEWAGTTIDDKNTCFSVSGIPTDAIDARLDVKVAIKTCKGHKIRPFMRLDIDSGTGTCTIPLDLLRATKRDLKFIIQLVLTTENESYASANWLTFKVSPAIASLPSQEPLTDLGPLFIDAEGNKDTHCIVFDRVNGDTDIVSLPELVIDDVNESEETAYSSIKTLELIQGYASNFAGKYDTHNDLIQATMRPDGKPIDIRDYAIVTDDKHGDPEEHAGQTWRYSCINPALLGSESAWACEYQIGEDTVPDGYILEKVKGRPEINIKSNKLGILPTYRYISANPQKKLVIGDGEHNAIHFSDEGMEATLNGDLLRVKNGAKTGEYKATGLSFGDGNKTVSMDMKGIANGNDLLTFTYEQGAEGKEILKPEILEAGDHIFITPRTDSQGNRIPGVKITATDAEGSTVVPSEEKVPGANTFGSLKIDGVDWNAPEGGEGTSVVPSEEKAPEGKNLAALWIDDEPWNINATEGKTVEITLQRNEDEWTAEINQADFEDIVNGAKIRWMFGESVISPEAFTSQILYEKSVGVHIILDYFNERNDTMHRFVGLIGINAIEGMHPVLIKGSQFGTVGLEEKPITTRTAKGLIINGVEWALPEGGGEGGTEVIPLENPVPQSPDLAALRIDGNAWNIPRRLLNITLRQSEESAFIWEGTIDHERYQKIISGYVISWIFSGAPWAQSGISSGHVYTGDQDGEYLHINMEYISPYGEKMKLAGRIEADAVLDEHKIQFVASEDGTVALPTRPDEAPIVRGLRIDGTEWALPEAGEGGTEVIPSTERVEGAETIGSLKIDGVNWNAPEGGEYPIIDVELSMVSQKEFTGTITAEQFATLKEGKTRLRGELDLRPFGGDLWTLYSTDISHAEHGNETVLCGMMATAYGTIGDFTIREDGHISAYMREFGSKVQALKDRFQSRPTAQSISIDNEIWNLPEGGETETVEIALTAISEEEFEGDLDDESYQKLKNGTARLKGTLDMRDIGRELWTLYCSDISQSIDGKGGITLCGMMDTANGTVGDFTIGEDRHLYAYLRRITGTEVIPLQERIEGADTVSAMEINGVVWNMPEGGEGGTARWGQIEGDISNQHDLKSLTDTLSTRISNAQSKADSAKSRADSAHDLAAGAVTEASAAAAGVAELEYRVEGTIAPAITALQGEVGTLQGEIAGKASSAEVQALRDRVSSAESEIRQLKSNLNTQTNRIDELWQFIETEIKTRFTFVENPNSKE